MFLTRIIKKNVFNIYLKLQVVLFNHYFFSYDNLLGRKNKLDYINGHSHSDWVNARQTDIFRRSISRQNT